MRHFAKWLAKVFGSALCICLVIVMLPYAYRLAARFLPDGSQNAVTVSMILSRRMEESARLETSRVEDEGVLTSSVNALWIGQVQNVVIQYTYEASLGIDLKKVQKRIEGNTLKLLIPPLEILSDSITVRNVDKQDFWFPLSENRRQKLLEDERIKCREHYLDENEEKTRADENTIRVMRELVDSLLNDTVGLGVDIVIAPAEET